MASSWGAHGDLSTWSGPAVADVAFALRRAELETVAARPHAGRAALRELLALQSSDWAFMLTRGLAAPYARERFELSPRGARALRWQTADAASDAARNLAARLSSLRARADDLLRVGRRGPRRYCQRIARGASRMRITRAGTPPTTAFSGTSLVTTALVPTMLLSPTLTPRSTHAP